MIGGSFLGIAISLLVVVEKADPMIIPLNPANFESFGGYNILICSIFLIYI